MNEPTLTYDKTAKRAVILFPNGHRLAIGNVDEEKANEFFRRNAAEFMKRDCVLHTAGGFEVRSNG